MHVPRTLRLFIAKLYCTMPFLLEANLLLAVPCLKYTSCLSVPLGMQFAAPVSGAQGGWPSMRSWPLTRELAGGAAPRTRATVPRPMPSANPEKCLT